MIGVSDSHWLQLNRAVVLPLRFLALIPVAVGINLAMGRIAQSLQLPVFLDTMGTILVAALAGPVAAVVTGVLTQLATGLLISSTLFAFLPIQVLVALYAAYASRRAVFATSGRTVLGGVILGAVAATVSWPISLTVFGGVTTGGVTVATTLLTGLGVPLSVAVFASSLFTDLLDKTASFLSVRVVLTSLPVRMRSRFPGAARAVGRS
jgi:energy-coupling factor transport system substrate-specific component